MSLPSGKMPSFRDQLHRFEPAFIAFVTVFLWVTLNLNIETRLHFPSGSDQDSYLLAGKEFIEDALFQWRAPFYSVWIGMFYLLSGQVLQSCFYLEKHFSVFLLSLLVACLGRKLFDTRTGLLIGIWVLNCKYFIIEANGTHAMVASLYTVSILSLLIGNQYARLPVALFPLFLATQVRVDMWLPFITIIVAIILVLIRRPLSSQSIKQLFAKPSIPYWTSCLALCVMISALFASRPGSIEPSIAGQAFVSNFAVNYVERMNLGDRYPQPWYAVDQILKEAVPGATDTWTAIRMYPLEIKAHVTYNLKLILRALGANVLALDNPLWMLTAALTYFGSYIIGQKQIDYLEKWKSVLRNSGPLFVIWFLALCWIIPMTMIFRAAARYYIPLIPLQICLFIYMTRAVMNRLPVFRRGLGEQV
jgi:hypothetical protein